MSFVGDIEIRLLEPGDENVVRALRTYEGDGDPEALLADPRTLMLVAFEVGRRLGTPTSTSTSTSTYINPGKRPVGFVLAHELPRRHGDRSKLFVYEVDVAETHRRRGIATALLERLGELACARGIRAGFVVTEPDNEPANALYRSVGGVSHPDVLWDFRYADN